VDAGRSVAPARQADQMRDVRTVADSVDRRYSEHDEDRRARFGRNAPHELRRTRAQPRRERRRLVRPAREPPKRREVGEDVVKRVVGHQDDLQAKAAQIADQRGLRWDSDDDGRMQLHDLLRIDGRKRRDLRQPRSGRRIIGKLRDAHDVRTGADREQVLCQRRYQRDDADRLGRLGLCGPRRRA
jgi:predicted GIY-YIG superfamily endonuclease